VVAAAIAWMNQHLPQESYIASSAASRHTEWIPVLSSFAWQELNAQDDLFTQEGEDLLRAAHNVPFTHLIFLTDHEKVPPGLSAQPESFPIIFENDAAVILQLP
jgi:hypothetical protein